MKHSLTCERAAAFCIGVCRAQIEASRAQTLSSDDPEGPHNLRIGLRRLRTALDLFGPAIAAPRTRALAQEAKWLGQEVGRTRDLEVLHSEILAPRLGTSVGLPAVQGFLAVLQALAEQERTGLKDLLRSSRADRFVTDLQGFFAHRQWLLPDDIAQTERLARPVGMLAGPALRKCWKRARSRAKHLRRLSETARHDLRKDLKKLRYGVEFLVPLFPDRSVGAFGKRLRTLQSVLGTWNDAAMARRIVETSLAPQLEAAGFPAEVADIVAGLQTAAAHGMPKAEKCWRSLRRSQKPWA